MTPARRRDRQLLELEQWFEHEHPFGHARMRQDEIRFSQHQIADQQQIEIEGAWCVRIRPLAPTLPFDVEQRRQQLSRCGFAEPDRDRVEVGRLSTGNADRRRLADGREPQIGEQRLEPGAGVEKMTVAVAEIRSEGYRNDPADYSIHRVDITEPTLAPT
jgi:hypothetical protein